MAYTFINDFGSAVAFEKYLENYTIHREKNSIIFLT